MDGNIFKEVRESMLSWWWKRWCVSVHRKFFDFIITLILTSVLMIPVSTILNAILLGDLSILIIVFIGVVMITGIILALIGEHYHDACKEIVKNDVEDIIKNIQNWDDLKLGNVRLLSEVNFIIVLVSLRDRADYFFRKDEPIFCWYDTFCLELYIDVDYKQLKNPTAFEIIGKDAIRFAYGVEELPNLINYIKIRDL